MVHQKTGPYRKVDDALILRIHSSKQNKVVNMTTKYNTERNKNALTFAAFVGVIYDFVDKRRFLVFFVSPLVFSFCCLILVSLVQGYLPTSFEEWASGFALPFVVSFGTYFVFFSDTGNHPAKGNENAFGCLLMLVYIPILVITYAVYRLIRVIITNCPNCKWRRNKEYKNTSLEGRINRLNELLSKGVITKVDYDEQLSRLIEK